ncbi:mitochondrial ribosomal protein S24 isoform X2 [Rhynchophorus ferrugineus]|uniref:mitochondrial ribosomal protein S24 isoform X2 n=1 Tax=Rhynchophorus ferrugineus TaxID=354439 RepID=UPI003FCED9C2
MNVLIKNIYNPFKTQCQIVRNLHVSPIYLKTQAGRYRITPKKDFPLTYEMANPPHMIASRKAWNSWNTLLIFS